MTQHILDRIHAVILERKAASADDSYVARLLREGLSAVRAKVREETGELLEASDQGTRAELTHEAADLLFHVLVLLAAHEVPAEAVWTELGQRFGTSGLVEKASRGGGSDR